MIGYALNGYKLTSAAFAAIIALGLIFVPTVYASAAPSTVSTKTKLYGSTSEEWAANWWQWVLSIPAESNPLLGATDCTVDQSRKVWYLVGVNGEINCNLPSGKALFLPIVNFGCFEVEEAFDEFCKDGDGEYVSKAPVDLATNLHLIIDGAEITNFADFRVESHLFEVTLPEGNPFAPAGTYKAVEDGYYAMIPHLSKGEHTINFGGEVSGISVDATYNVIVG